MRDRPVIFVIGCTGTGKSDLGVQIALKYNGEVMNADALQVYQGLDIATNKISSEEAMGVPHHLIGFLSPRTVRFNVQEYQTLALQVISDIHSRNRLPVVVGGTAYYVESLLYTNNFISTDGSDEDCDDLDEMSNDELHAELARIDPASAARVHRNNRARVRRAIEIFRKCKKPKSAILAERRAAGMAGDRSGGLRFENSLVLHLDAPPQVLDDRLDRRVVKMRTGGLRDELESFYDKYRTNLEANPFGVAQCIGLKEFFRYLSLPLAERRTPRGDREFEQGIQDVQLHTRQYSRRQRNWTRSRLQAATGIRPMPSLVHLDSSCPSSLFSSGVSVVGAFLEGESFPIEEVSRAESVDDSNAIRHCEVCSRDISGTVNWERHITGRAHRHALKRLRRNNPSEAHLPDNS